ncbi:hypothetical protein BJ508DRAFT_374687 [Ascobolus immersus RN42]|uniref:Uncharacterized protein n=1 Tax=Ascobolus immersus RN42 TaxID=1160509 RepID=A0A3N4ICC4_ASCIM|nr:hypothetical protein BJ508DRAFT_374687 [Ascobolus immersus RN42]
MGRAFGAQTTRSSESPKMERHWPEAEDREGSYAQQDTYEEEEIFDMEMESNGSNGSVCDEGTHEWSGECRYVIPRDGVDDFEVDELCYNCGAEGMKARDDVEDYDTYECLKCARIICHVCLEEWKATHQSAQQ